MQSLASRRLLPVAECRIIHPCSSLTSADVGEAVMAQLMCQDCGARLKIGPEMSGKKVRCPKCRAIMRVPAETPQGTPKTAVPKAARSDFTEAERPRRKS